MTIEVSEIRRSYRYNGINLPDVPGLSPREVRDLYSAQYPELGKRSAQPLPEADQARGFVRNGRSSSMS